MTVIRQYNYHCKNKECEHFVKQVVIEKNKNDEDTEEPCYSCNKPLYRIGILNAFYVRGSRTPEELQKSLSQRSRKHYAPNKDEWHQKNKPGYKP